MGRNSAISNDAAAAGKGSEGKERKRDDVQAHATTTAGLCVDGEGDAFGGCRLEPLMAGRKERKGKDGEVSWKVK